MEERTAELPADLEERLYDAFFAASDEERFRQITRLCEEHPEHAEALRRTFALLDGSDRMMRAVACDPPEQTPAAIGPYAVLHEVGRGGFGVVYLAAQQAPLQRRVAVKLLRPGAGDQQTLARFQAERQALAVMDHPCIAKVFDAGSTPDGRPYFVMEYVGGVPLSTYCDRSRLTVRARLELFMDVCAGVQHAHHKGIIHRDLKPTNILVVEADGRPVPKIIDFGVAKALYRPLIDGTLHTEAGRVIGTPDYMSPEQAQGHQLDVDVRSDVFSLGVILYELLTGSLPWSPEERVRGPQGEPVKPSTLVSEAGGSSAEVADHRRTQPRRLAGDLRGDLDWITLKALSVERGRRYQSPHELAEDIRRHLEHQAVSAGPPSLAYRLSKAVRRYRIQFAAAAAVLLSLIAGLFASTTFAVQARAHLKRFEILAVGVKLREAAAASEKLYPAWPENIPRLLAWLSERGEPLVASLPGLERALEDIRARAMPDAEAQLDRDGEVDPRAEEIRRLRENIEYGKRHLTLPEVHGVDWSSVLDQMATFIARSEERLRELTTRPYERLARRFEEPSEQFLHDALLSLTSDLRRFVHASNGTMASVRARLERARTLAAALEAGRDRWAEVRTEIARDPKYGGLELVAQAGLVPLGRDEASGLHEFYLLDSAPSDGAVPLRGPDGGLQLGDVSGAVLVLLPGGRFMIGAQSEDPAAPNHDPHAAVQASPVHEVDLVPFFLAKHELTQAQWFHLTAQNPSAMHDGIALKWGRIVSRRHPVENVDSQTCAQVLRRFGLLLPTEAQWEYACRAGTDSPYPTGREGGSLQGYANAADAFAARHSSTVECDESFEDGFRYHAPVGSFRPNGFGLHDMLGNVSEWCADFYGSFSYVMPPRSGDGLRPVPNLGHRVVRGGSASTLPAHLRSYERSFSPPNQAFSDTGVRPARELRR